MHVKRVVMFVRAEKDQKLSANDMADGIQVEGMICTAAVERIGRQVYTDT